MPRSIPLLPFMRERHLADRTGSLATALPVGLIVATDEHGEPATDLADVLGEHVEAPPGVSIALNLHRLLADENVTLLWAGLGVPEHPLLQSAGHAPQPASLPEN